MRFFFSLSYLVTHELLLEHPVHTHILRLNLSFSRPVEFEKNRGMVTVSRANNTFLLSVAGK